MTIAATIAPATATSAPAATGAPDSARATLAGNFNDFLRLLMTQLKNQDPSSPLDSNQFTSQLVQFASVEQQINANSNLTTLIGLTQGEQVLQAAGLVGKNVLVSSDHIPLQQGSGGVSLTAATAQPVMVTITTEGGTMVRNAVIAANAGTNQWSWDGRNNAGSQMPDGSYKISMAAINADGSAAAQAFAVRGTVTGMGRQGTAVDLDLGAQVADLSTVQQVLP